MGLHRFVRHIRADLDVDDDTGHVSGLVVPYGTPTHVVDEEGEYDEMFTPTSFAGMLQGYAAAPNRVRTVAFQMDHRHELDRQIGYATALESSEDGLFGEFSLYDTADARKVRSMLQTSHTGLSIDFGARSTRTGDGGVRERLGVHLYAVAATPSPAYPSAQILAVRSDPEPARLDTPRLDAAMARWGLVTSPQTTQ